MAWPQSQEYNEAIQNPRICFTDPDLKQGSVKLNAMGLPVPISGAFANVYQVTTATGKWAIRCFVREVKDSHRRYDEISKALGTNRPAYTAPFEYQRNGIRVGSTAYPIVKMQWLTGELLSEYIARNLSNPAQLTQFADKWAALMSDMRTRKIAHGDLQHGNILVVNDEPKLIDYDGMFVPAFQGLRSNEVGHPNFQHPQRKETDFGTFTDNFSAWVIYACVRVIATSPEIYNFSRGLGRDEGLLFSREDYANPSISPIFGQLRQHPDDTVVRLAQQISSFIAKSPKDVPPLDTAAFPSTVVVTTGAAAKDWWRGHLASESEAPKILPPHLPAISEIGSQVRAQREMLGGIIVCCGAFIAGQTGAIGMVGFWLFQSAAVFAAERRLRYHFNETPAGAARNRHFQEVHLKAEELEEKKANLVQLRAKMTVNAEQERYLNEHTQARVAEITGIQGNETKQAYSEKAVSIAVVARKLQALNAEEVRSLQAAVDLYEPQITKAQAELGALPAKKTELFNSMLKKEHAAAIRANLALHYVSQADIPGIGPKFRSSLKNRGIVTAAHVTFGAVRVIPGFGQSRTAAIVAWKDGIEAHYRMRLLKDFSDPAVRQAERQFRDMQDSLELALERARNAAQSARIRVSQEYQQKRSQISSEEQGVLLATETRVAVINSKYSRQIATQRTDTEQKIRALRKDTANAQAALNSLETDIRRLESWHREVGVPRTKRYEETLTFSKYLKIVFTSKFNS